VGFKNWLWERRSKKARRIRWKLKDKGIHVWGQVWKRKKWRLKGKWINNPKAVEGYFCEKCLEYVDWEEQSWETDKWSFFQAWCKRCGMMLCDRRLKLKGC
jgi:hypothetical protein